MSFSDPPPPPFTPHPFPPADGGGSGVWPSIVMNPEHSGSIQQFEHQPPYKRPKYYDNSPPNSAAFPSMNPRINPPNFSGSKGTSHIFYKTRMCAKFLEGNCKNGEQCTFAHGVEDLHEPPPNWQELVREKDRGAVNWSDDQKVINRMKICRKFYNGEECSYGDKCNFLHERPMKFKTDMPRQRESAAISIGTTGPSLGNQNEFRQPEPIRDVNGHMDASRQKTVFWKTKLCSKWEIGQCPFGERCHFAHGESELHVPGARVEGDMVMNSGPIPPKPISIPAAVPTTDSYNANMASGAMINHNREDKLSRWKLTGKINRIYGDWLDDLSPDQSPNRDEI